MTDPHCLLDPHQPNPDMICGTFRMMLRVWVHPPTAIRNTSRDLGVEPELVRQVLARDGAAAGLHGPWCGTL